MSNVVVSTAQVQTLVKRAVIDLFQEVVADPDRCLELQNWVKDRLTKIDTRDSAEAHLNSLADVANRSG